MNESGSNVAPAACPWQVNVYTIDVADSNPNVIYAGTETGFYISYNGGDNWKQLQLNLPVVAITDLKVHENHLLAATQGRAFWILDDLEPIRKYNKDTAANHLFAVRKYNPQTKKKSITPSK